MRRLRSISLLAVLVVTSLAAAAEPKREDGLSVYFMPERLAKMRSDKAAGFQVTGRHQSKEKKVYATAEELLQFLKTLAPSVRENGVWVVTSAPNAYAEGELKALDRLKELCAQNSAPLFVSRAADLPNGWKKQN